MVSKGPWNFKNEWGKSNSEVIIKGHIIIISIIPIQKIDFGKFGIILTTVLSPHLVSTQCLGIQTASHSDS